MVLMVDMNLFKTKLKKPYSTHHDSMLGFASYSKSLVAREPKHLNIFIFTWFDSQWNIKNHAS